MNQDSTNYRSNDRAVAPFARRWLRAFGCLSSIYVLFVFAIDGSLHFLWGVLLVGIGLISLFAYTRSKRRYYTPLILTIFYFFGYLLSFTYILLNKDEMPVAGFMAIGPFGFTDAEFFPVVLVICAGMAGIMVATFSAEKIFKHFHAIKAKRIEPILFSIKTTTLRNWVWLWFIFSVALIMLMWHLEIGRVGMKDETILPFKLAGIFFFLRGIVVPFGGFLLLGLSISADKKKLTKLILCMLIFVGILGSIAGISRGYFVITVFPALLFMFLTSYKNDWNRKILSRYMFAIFIITLISIVFVQGLRNIGYAGGDISIFEVAGLLTIMWSDFDLVEAFSAFISLATSRIGGMRELLAASSSGVSDLYAPWAIFISDGKYLEDLLFSVFGFLPAADDLLAFGVVFGLWGGLALSGSYTVVFWGTIMSCLIVMFVEELFIRKKAYSVACFLSVYLCMFIWGGVYLFFLVRIGVSILLCYVIVKLISKLSYQYRYELK